MAGVRFEWDPSKDRANLRKHAVSFEEASSVFLDENAVLIDDPDHSAEGDDRFILLGLSRRLRVLVVVHCYRDIDAIIRIISARKATTNEQRTYTERWKRT